MIISRITNRINYKIHLIICFIYLQNVDGLVVKNEVLEMGRTQYNLLKDKSTLPHYGSCWKSAVQHLETSCRYLNEDIQSEIALHITNCFLQMSGHPTYDCELDKKVNLRAICINSMSDRAFNVYTEFYTHTQNICWFLQGQIWNEIIADNTILVGKQLKETAQNQEGLLQAQTESFKLQMQMFEHGKVLENVLHDIFVSFETNQSTLKLLSATINKLQDWIVGEISWIDSTIFYSISVLTVFTLTATRRTSSARLPILLLFFFHLLIERYFCSITILNNSGIEAHILHSSIYNYIWYSRYGLLILAATIFIYKAFFHNDILTKQFELLCLIQNQNNCILSILNKSKNNSNFYEPKITLIGDRSENFDSCLKDDICISHMNCGDGDIPDFNPNFNSTRDTAVDKYDCASSKTKHKKFILPIIENDNKIHDEIRTARYNLRSGSILRQCETILEGDPEGTFWDPQMGNCFTCFKEPTQTALDQATDHKDKEEMTEVHLHPAPSHVPAPSATHDTNLSNGNHLSAPPEVTTALSRLCQPSRRTHTRSAAAIMGISDSKPSETKLNGLFEQYKDNGEDSILAEGIEQFCQDLQVSPDDFKILVLAWKLNAEQMCRFTRLEFITGMKAIRADSIKSLQVRLPELVSEVNNNYELFKDLYRFTFRFGLDSSSGQRILPTDMAVILWKLVFTIREPPILNRWLNFLETHQITRGIPKDTWNMFLNFSEHVANDLSCYDDNEAWPSLFDDFVEYENDQVNQNISKDIEKESDGLIIKKN